MNHWGRSLFRALIVVLLFGIGFGAEHFYQSFLARGKRTDDASTSDSIVLLGGSIANGLGPKIEAFLSPALDARVVEATEAMLGSDGLATKFASVIERHRPKMLLVQVGLSETSSDGLDWKAKTISDLEKRDVSSLSDRVGALLRAGRTGELKTFVRFVIQERERIHGAGFDSVLTGLVDSRLEVLLEKVEEDADARRQVDYLVFAGRYLRSPKAASFAKEMKRFEPARKAKLVESTFEQIVTISKEWPGMLERLGQTEFVKAGRLHDPYLRYWFCTVWLGYGRKSGMDGVSFFTRHPEHLTKAFGTPLSFSADPVVSPLLAPREPKSLWNAILGRRQLVDLELFHDESVLENVRARFMENLKSAMDVARRSDVRVVLLQFPNRDLEMVTAAGRDFGIQVIENEGFFEDKIAARGRAAWFLDQIGSSGHLTEEGLSIYGRFIAERLNQSSM